MPIPWRHNILNTLIIRLQLPISMKVQSRLHQLIFIVVIRSFIALRFKLPSRITSFSLILPIKVLQITQKLRTRSIPNKSTTKRVSNTIIATTALSINNLASRHSFTILISYTHFRYSSRTSNSLNTSSSKKPQSFT